MKPPAQACYGLLMHVLRARVRNGRLVLDEPTDLPEGAEVELMPVDELDDDEREELHRALRESVAQMRAGQLVDAEELISKLRSRA